MRRLLRILDRSAAVLLTDLWAALAVLWVRGYWATTDLLFSDGVTVWQITASEGRVDFIKQWDIYGLPFEVQVDLKDPARSLGSDVGPSATHYDPGGWDMFIITAFSWQIAILLAPYPLWYAWRWRSQRRRRRARGFAVLPVA